MILPAQVGWKILFSIDQDVMGSTSLHPGQPSICWLHLLGIVFFSQAAWPRRLWLLVVDWYLDNFGKAASSFTGADKPDKHSKEQATTCPDLTTPHDCWIWIRCLYRHFSIFIWWFNSPFVVGTKCFTSFVQNNPPSLPRPVSPQHASYWSVAVVSLSWRLGRRRSLKWV